MEDKYSNIALRERGAIIAKSLEMREFGRMISDGRGYSDLSKHLLLADQDKTAKFLAGFCGTGDGETEPYFPNGEELGRYTNRIVHIDWFRPKRTYTANELQPKVDAITDAFRMDRKKAEVVKNIDAAGYAACDADWYAVRNAVRDSACDAALDAVMYAALDAVMYAVWYSFGDAVWGAGHIIIKDIPEYKKNYPVNPWERMIDIYELGLWPAGPKDDRFLVWHPPVVEKGACLTIKSKLRVALNINLN